MSYLIIIILVVYLLIDKRPKKTYNKKNVRKQVGNGESKPEWNPDWRWNENTQKWENIKNIQTSPESEKESIDYAKAYQAKYLLTKNEWYEYKKLKQYAAEKQLQVCPKVRLLDLIEPKQGKGYMSALGKIQSKHVDFVITDPDLRIKAILELDDNSHNTADRKERDQFVDMILSSVGYKVIHTRSITEETLKDI